MSESTLQHDHASAFDQKQRLAFMPTTFSLSTSSGISDAGAASVAHELKTPLMVNISPALSPRSKHPLSKPTRCVAALLGPILFDLLCLGVRGTMIP